MHKICASLKFKELRSPLAPFEPIEFNLKNAKQ